MHQVDQRAAIGALRRPEQQEAGRKDACNSRFAETLNGVDGNGRAVKEERKSDRNQRE
jgi:hypothetical protein